MRRALPTGGMALPLSVLLFLQQPATHSKERGLEEEGLGEVGGVLTGAFIFNRISHISDGAAGRRPR